MEEIWKEVKDYESLYEVSNFGNVRSCDRTVMQDNHGTICKRFYPGKQLTPHNRANGYYCVHLSKDGKTKWLSIHRLVAEAFVEKPEGCDIVNHLDNNPGNNRSDNLEWTTYKGNMQWAAKQGRMKGSPNNLKKAIEKKKKKVIAKDKYGNIFEFDSIAEAARNLNCNRRHIQAICKKVYGYKTNHGYFFEFKEDVV